MRELVAKEVLSAMHLVPLIRGITHMMEVIT